MYSITNVEPKDLSKIKVQKQDQIMQLTGKKLDAKDAFEIIKRETDGFKKSSDKAKEADKLLVQLLRLNGITVTGDESLERKRKRMLIEAQSRERELALLELELELAA